MPRQGRDPLSAGPGTTDCSMDFVCCRPSRSAVRILRIHARRRARYPTRHVRIYLFSPDIPIDALAPRKCRRVSSGQLRSTSRQLQPERDALTCDIPEHTADAKITDTEGQRD